MEPAGRIKHTFWGYYTLESSQSVSMHNETYVVWNSNLMMQDFPHDIRIRSVRLFFLLHPDVALSLPCCLSQVNWYSQQGCVRPNVYSCQSYLCRIRSRILCMYYIFDLDSIYLVYIDWHYLRIVDQFSRKENIEYASLKWKGLLGSKSTSEYIKQNMEAFR